jgi:starch synthase
MKIIHISAECYPVAKVGGLADVVGALPKYQQKAGIISQVIMPLYNNRFQKENTFQAIYSSQLALGEATIDFDILTLQKNTLGFDIFFVDIPELLYQEYVYSPDDTERFLAFQIAVLDWMLTLKQPPDIVHCHDHHSALVPFMLQESYKYKALQGIPTILTIHNAQYQGWFSYDKLALIPNFDLKNIGLLDWNHIINPLAAGIKCAWRVTTVSPSYLEELKIKANGLESLLRHESAKCIGILNGIDTNVWNPETDTFIRKNYTQRTIVSGKKANKKWLCKEFNIDAEKPLLVFIGRLVEEKGAHLFSETFDIALRNLPISILLLGSGNKSIEHNLQKLKEKYKGTYNAHIGYDEKLAHLMYAGADFLLMPSLVEPCGLNQLYALRYGTIPVVSNVGGLKDTVVDIANHGFGIVHRQTTVKEVYIAIGRACELYKNQKEFRAIRKSIMQLDHSWDASAKEYITLYHTLIS